MAAIHTYGLGTRSAILKPASDTLIHLDVSGEHVEMVSHDTHGAHLLEKHALPDSARVLIDRHVRETPHYRVSGGVCNINGNGFASGVACATLSYVGSNEVRECGGVVDAGALVVHELLPGSNVIYVVEDTGQWQTYERLFVVHEHAHLVVVFLTKTHAQMARLSHVVMMEEYASAHWYDAAHYTGYAIGDAHVVLTHDGAHSSSRLVMRSVHSDMSRCVIQGSIHMRQGSHHAHGSQDLGALMDSAHAQVSPVPHLFAYHDQVACSHAARVARVSPHDIFYCATRGIPPEDARRSLTHAHIMSAVPDQYTVHVPESFFYDKS